MGIQNMAICTGVSNFFQKTLEVFELKKNWKN